MQSSSAVSAGERRADRSISLRWLFQIAQISRPTRICLSATNADQRLTTRNKIIMSNVEELQLPKYSDRFPFQMFVQQRMCFLRDFVCVSVFSYLPRSTCVCGGPCPWGLLFWFNGAPHGWAQSDTSDPAKGDARWSWSYSSSSEKRRPGSQTMFTCIDTSWPCRTTENRDFKCANRDILAWHEAVLLNCLIVAAGAEMYFTFGNKQHFHMWFSLHILTECWGFLAWLERVRIKYA